MKDKIANSPAGIAYRGGYTWILAGLGETERARAELHATMELTHAFDANWLSLQVELAEASVLVGDATFGVPLYERLAPYAGGRPVTAGRAACSYGAVDRSLGGLASLLGRERDAVRHLEDAIRLNTAFGAAVWRARAERDLARTMSREPLAGQTDQRDAERVLRLLMIDALHAVRVPTVEEEAIRDLVRAREDVIGDLMRARQRLSKLLLRHDILCEDTASTWTQRHRAWLRAQDPSGG